MEAEFLNWLRTSLPRSDRLIVGLGDDAAVLDWSNDRNCVVTSDLLADGVHFRWSQHSPQEIGRKSIAVNLSDLAAMAAHPVGVVVSLLLPSRTEVSQPVEIQLADLQQLYAGMLPLADEFDFVIAGGDTNTWAGSVVLSVTAFGVCEQSPLTRSGARPGDQLLVTGQLGGSIAGHHLNFTPRIQDALLLRRGYEIHACLDISDGLALDASRMAAASGCGIEIETAAVPISEAAQSLHRAQPEGPTAVARALGDGEDFELLLAVADEEAKLLLRDQPLEIPLTRIGKVLSERGLWQRTAKGQRMALPITGYLHD